MVDNKDQDHARLGLDTGCAEGAEIVRAAPPGRAEPASESMGDAIMNRWWMGVTLLAVGWLPHLAWGQATVLPSPVGAARIPEPDPEYVPPPLIQGPLRPELAPPGPSDELSLPMNHASAFQEETFPLEEAWWFNIGAMGLTRNGWGSLPLFYADPTTFLDTGTVPNRVTPINFVVDANNLPRPWLVGVRGSLGFIYSGHYAVELAGFTMFEDTVQLHRNLQGRLNSFFVNPPIGLEGNNGMWLQADRVAVQRSTRMNNAEISYRYTSGAVREPELIVGFRYYELIEQFGIYTGDDDLTFVNSQFLPDSRRQASLSYQARNRLLAPQLGFEWAPIQNKVFMLGVNMKGAWGVNFTEIDSTLTRGDGFQGFHGSRSKAVFSHVYEIGAFLDVCPLERLRVRAGYQAMWILGIADVQDQVDFNLRATSGSQDYTGSQFWHGPMCELQFLF